MRADGPDSPVPDRHIPDRPVHCDGGVMQRLARRTRTAAAVSIILGVAVLMAALLLPNGVVTVFAALLALAAIGIGVFCTGQATLWAGMRRAQMPNGGGASATIGPSTPLSPGRPGAPLRRRLGAVVVPVRVANGPQPGGGAVLIHGRADGVAPAAGDKVQVWRATRSGPEALTVESAPADAVAAVRGRFVLRRDSDGALFVGTTRLTDAL